MQSRAFCCNNTEQPGWQPSKESPPGQPADTCLFAVSSGQHTSVNKPTNRQHAKCAKAQAGSSCVCDRGHWRRGTADKNPSSLGPSSSLLTDLEKQQRMARGRGSLHSSGRPLRSSWFQTLQLSGVNQQMGARAVWALGQACTSDSAPCRCTWER